MLINLRQNKNAESAAYGKYFAEVDSKEPLNLKGLKASCLEEWLALYIVLEGFVVLWAGG